MGSKERRERERDATRSRILDAARELFALHGYEGVSMRAIAEKIEYSPTVIYQHFRDKDTLIKELCYADFGDLAEALQNTLQIPDPIERLRECGRQYARFAIAHPNHYRLMFMTPIPVQSTKEEIEQVQGKPESDAYALLLHLVQQVAAEGLFRDPNPDPQLIAQTLWAGLHGLVALEITMKCDEWTPWRSFDSRLNTMLDTMGRGLFKEVN
jgi:AcrR family transcriptional regulator